MNNQDYFQENYCIDELIDTNTKRAILLSEEEASVLLSEIKKKIKYIKPYHNYYDDLEFMNGIIRFIDLDAHLSNKQMIRILHLIEKPETNIAGLY